MTSGAVVPAAPLAVLERLRRAPAPALEPTPVAPVAPGCDLCREPIGEEHPHLVDLHARSLMCACRGCYLLFSSSGAGGDHFKAVPDRYIRLDGLPSAGAAGGGLEIPVGVAFFFFNSALGRIAALYPGPAGATESELALDAWEVVTAGGGPVSTLEPDVEAVIVRTAPKRSGRSSGAAEWYLVPIDCCYELVGQLRLLWRGFDGGQEAQQALDDFFTRIRGRCR
jgi:hypothetical protein